MKTNEYPTTSQLSKIKHWDWKDFEGLMNFIKPIWQYADSGYWKQEGDTYNISTAGWSGNEKIIESLEKNPIVWAMNWISSKRGGHYEFCNYHFKET